MKYLFLAANALQLIHHTIGNFNILPDKLAVSRINESLSTLQQARDLRLREAENALKSKLPMYPASKTRAQYPITSTTLTAY
jgi:kinetochore protein Spc24